MVNTIDYYYVGTYDIINKIFNYIPNPNGIVTGSVYFEKNIGRDTENLILFTNTGVFKEFYFGKDYRFVYVYIEDIVKFLYENSIDKIPKRTMPYYTGLINYTVNEFPEDRRHGLYPAVLNNKTMIQILNDYYSCLFMQNAIEKNI